MQGFSRELIVEGKLTLAQINKDRPSIEVWVEDRQGVSHQIEIGDNEAYAVEFLNAEGGVRVNGCLGALDVNPAGLVTVYLAKDDLSLFTAAHTFKPASRQSFLRLFRLKKEEI